MSFEEVAEEIRKIKETRVTFKPGDRVGHIFCVAHMQGVVKGINQARKAFILWDSLRDLKKISKVPFKDLVKL